MPNAYRTSAYRILRVAASAALAATVIGMCRLVEHVNSTTVALILLLAVLGVSTWWGLVEAGVASVVAVVGFNYYFLPPVGTLTIADPQNWVALVVFLVVSVTASQLSARAKRRTREAEQRRREIERLHELGRAMLLRGRPREMTADTVARLVEIYRLSAAAFYSAASGEVSAAGSADFDRQRLAAAAQAEGTVTAGDAIFIPVRLGGQPVGSLALSGEAPSPESLQALANLVAIGIERARALEDASRAEAARQSEILKSALLDALAHDLKTPLTSIKAAATSMLSQPRDGADRELLSIIDEESDRLNQTVAEVIEMARIESGKLHPERRLVTVKALVEAALESSAAFLRERDIRVDLPPDLPPVDADPELIQHVLRQLLDNGARYSPPATPLTITAERRERKVLVSVTDRGPGVPERDQARIFERFFRGPEQARTVPGTGMGLAIAKGIVEAHGGKIWVASQPGQGSVFTFSLPVRKGDPQ